MTIKIHLHKKIVDDIYAKADRDKAKSTDVCWSIPIVLKEHMYLEHAETHLTQVKDTMLACKDYIQETFAQYITKGSVGYSGYSNRHAGNLSTDGHSYLIVRSTRADQLREGIKKLINPAEKKAGLFGTRVYKTEHANILLLKGDGCYSKVLPLSNMWAMLIRMQFYNHIVKGDTLEEYIENFESTLRKKELGNRDVGYINTILKVTYSNVFNTVFSIALDYVIPEYEYIDILKKAPSVHDGGGIMAMIKGVNNKEIYGSKIQTKKTLKLLKDTLPWKGQEKEKEEIVPPHEVPTTVVYTEEEQARRLAVAQGLNNAQRLWRNKNGF